MPTTPETLDALIEEVIIKPDDIESLLLDDEDDDIIALLKENTKISIFDSEFLLEGEM